MKKILLLILTIISMTVMADSYDENNYQPTINTIKLDKTNLPIVFINTQKQVIHKDWRIAVRMKIINNSSGINYGDTISYPDQTIDYDGWIGIRYRGNTSFNWSDKKPYNFKTLKTSDINGEKQKISLLGMPKDNSWILLAPFADRSMLRDVLVFQLARPYFDYTPNCRYCELILDGIYYGIFILTESVSKGKNRLNLDDPGESGDKLTGGYQLQIDRDDEPHFTSNFIAVDSYGKPYTAYNEIYFQYKHPDFEEMTAAQIEYIQQRINLMENTLASENFTDQNTGYEKYLDPLSFIDQQLSQEFSGNIDGYRLSTNIYKKRDSVDPRFKTALWDFNLAFGNSSAANATETDFWRYQNNYFTNYNCYNKVPFWWMRLMEDPSYVIKLKERWVQYRKENYTIDNIYNKIDSITSFLKEYDALERNNNAWKMFNNSTYDMEINNIKTWINKRIAWMDEQLEYNDYSNIEFPTGKQNKKIIGYYTLQGVQLNFPKEGIIIIKYQDGSTRKIKL